MTTPPISKADGYANLVTGVATAWDKSGHSMFAAERLLSVGELGLQYELDALAARCVDRVVDDATRCTWRIRSTDNGDFDWSSVQSELEDLQAMRVLGDAWRWSRLYGGALTIAAVDDGQNYDQPLNLKTARALRGLSVIDSTCVIPDGFNPGLGSNAFSLPYAYSITVPNGGFAKVHPSRVIRFDGIRVPASRMIMNGGWGPSVLQRINKDLRRLGTAMGYAEALMQEVSVMVLKIPGLREMLCSAGGESDVKQMLTNLRWSIDNLHILAIEGGPPGVADDFHEVQRTVAGVATLIDRFVDALVRATGMPRVILLGEQPGGLNSDSKGEVRAWYDYVESQQKQVLAVGLNRLIQISLAIRANQGDAVPSEWTIEFESLVSESRETSAATLKTWADAHAVLITNGIETAAEARESGRAAGILDVQSLPEPVTAAPAEAMGVPDAAAGEPEPNADDLAWESSGVDPGDLAEARQIAETLGVPTVRITRAHREGLIRGWRLLGGRPRYSMREIKALILADNPEG
jgi:phage-related protein (TIGR01555 family)